MKKKNGKKTAMRLFMLRHRTQRSDDKETPPPAEPPTETKVVPPAPAETKVVPPAPAADKPKPPASDGTTAAPPVPAGDKTKPVQAALPPAPPRPALAKASPETADSGYTVSKEGKVLRKQALRLWEGDIPQFIEPNDNPDIHWRGGRIHLGLLCQCLRFFRHGVDKYDSEVQLRLAYNENTGEWCATSFPQRVRRGTLAVEEIKTTLLTPTQREQRDLATAQLYEQGFTLNGTIHSHCNASAFQSGTDEKDETNQPGVHITLGHVSQDEIEVHGRVTYRGVQYPIHWNEWLDGITGMPDDSDKFVIALEKDRVNGYSYPEQWDDTLYEAPTPSAYSRFTGASAGSAWPYCDYDYDGGFGFGYSRGDNTQRKDYDSEWGKKLREEALRVTDKKSDDEDRLSTCDDLGEPLEYFLPDRKQFNSPDEWVAALCVELWNEAPKCSNEPYFDVLDFNNELEYEPIPLEGAFEFFRTRLAQEMVLLLTGRKRLDEFDGNVAAGVAPFMSRATGDLCDYIIGETTVADLQVYGVLGIRPSDNQLVMRSGDLTQLISTFLEEFLQRIGDDLFNGMLETLAPATGGRWSKKDGSDIDQEERVAVLWAMLQLVAHHTDLRIPGVTRRLSPANTPPPPPPPPPSTESPDDMEDFPDDP